MMPNPPITYVMFLIFAGTAALSTMALYTRQSLLVAYIALGALFGPYALKLVNNPTVIGEAGNIGIIFLLFLLGLDLQPQSLFHSLRKMSSITFGSSAIFFLIAALPCYLMGFSIQDCIIIGIAAMFSSTIISLKLLPTTILHHQHTGELVISILLLQDIIAIITLFGLGLIGKQTDSILDLSLIIIAFPTLLIAAYFFQRYVLAHLMARFDKIHEYIFILSIGWCLFMAELSHLFHLSEQIGAFIAGVALASNPIASYIAESLKPLRDFFLVIFFFAIGAGIDFSTLSNMLLPACLLASLLLLLKPLVFKWLLQLSGEVKKVSSEIGVRLGQMSEFSLLVAYSAINQRVISIPAAHMLEAAIILTFIASCYWTVIYFPTPLAFSDKLRRD